MKMAAVKVMHLPQFVSELHGVLVQRRVVTTIRICSSSYHIHMIGCEPYVWNSRYSPSTLRLQVQASTPGAAFFNWGHFVTFDDRSISYSGTHAVPSSDPTSF